LALALTPATARVLDRYAVYGSLSLDASTAEVTLDSLLEIDWRAIFVPQNSLIEPIIRGTIMYLGILAMLRLVLRRQVGGIGTADVLVVVLIAEVAGNSIAPNEQSVVEGILLVATILFWSYLIEWLQFRFPGFQRLMRDPKLKLIDNGRMLRRNMRREFVTSQELMAQVREKGLEDCSRVKSAYLEADGSISIIEGEH
jgi:uncharacterized membrane protein YcaP (DUF421 family)